AAGRELAAAPGIIDPFDAEVPLDDYAAALAATDLLITVDTMAAHCAGAMGHPVWIAVPFSPQWTWGFDRATTPWYPTARLFRQTKPRAWRAAIDALARALQEKFGARRRASAAGAALEPEAVADNAKAAQVLAQTAAALLSHRRPDLARAVADLSLRTDADCAEAHDAVADILENAGAWEPALVHRRAAAAGAPGLRLKLAAAQLVRGDHAEGFANYEARLSVPAWIEQALPFAPRLTAGAAQRRGGGGA